MQKDKPILILAIETSCDETAASVVRFSYDTTSSDYSFTVLSNIIASQIDIHKLYGGVVPEIASRNHTLNIGEVVKTALEAATVKDAELDCIAVTQGAGLLGALLVGVSFAKAYAYALKKPLIAVNHILGHIAVNHVASQGLRPPYLCLLASGGHTAVLKVAGYPGAAGAISVLGQTQDDAAGEAFDKAARVLGLPYPGGPQIERLAKSGEPTYNLPTPKMEGMDFSFSGIKTAVVNLAANAKARGEEINKANLAASFQDKVTAIMAYALSAAVAATGINRAVIAGGVGANATLRQKVARIPNIEAHYPPPSLCTDNAVMIAAAAAFMLVSGAPFAGLDTEANANLKMNDE